jgi:hypothetical protein
VAVIAPVQVTVLRGPIAPALQIQIQVQAVPRAQVGIIPLGALSIVRIQVGEQQQNLNHPIALFEVVV